MRTQLVNNVQGPYLHKPREKDSWSCAYLTARPRSLPSTEVIPKGGGLGWQASHASLELSTSRAGVRAIEGMATELQRCELPSKLVRAVIRWADEPGFPLQNGYVSYWGSFPRHSDETGPWFHFLWFCHRPMNKAHWSHENNIWDS